VYVPRFHDLQPYWLTYCTGWFATKIFHPNVSSAGEICVNTLKKDWKSSYGIGHILVTVKCLLIYPNPESALDEEAGKLLLENYDGYCDRAKLITTIHATPRVRPVEFDTQASSSSSKGTTVSSAASTSTSPAPAASSKPSLPPHLPTTAIAATPIFTLPIVTRKSSSPAPQPLPLKSSPSNLSGDKGINTTNNKDRHTSPSPLSTADANVSGGGKAGSGMGMEMAGGTPAPTKAVKRAATGGGATGAEKRKKALKRL